MSKPEFAMSMFASRADLYEAKANYFEQELVKLRDDMSRKLASAAGADVLFMADSDKDIEFGKAHAYEEAVDGLNNVLGE